LVDRSRHAYALSLGVQEPDHSLRFFPLWDRQVVDLEQEGRISSHPVAWNGRLLLLLDNGDLWLFDSASGEGTRLAELGGSAPYPPYILGDVAYVALAETAEGKGAIIAFDLAGQQVRWRVILDGLLAAPFDVADGQIFVQTSAPGGGSLLALDAISGSRIWENQTLTQTGPPLAAGGSVCLASEEVSCWDSLTGQLRWQSPNITAGGTPIACGETLYTSALRENKPALAALDLVTGEVRWWSQDDVASLYGRPACDLQSGLVFVGGFDGRIHAYDAATGRLRWTHLVGEPFFSDVAVADGVVYALTVRNTLVALEAGSGQLLARYAPYTALKLAACLVLGNRVYLADSFFLYALEAIRA
jgi:outer membrane protein assembly factor BamB